MWLFNALSTLFYNAYLWVWDIAWIASEIWVVGDRIAPVFYDFAYELYAISWRFKELSYWADNLETQIRDVLTWDQIRVYVEELIPSVNWTPWEVLDSIWGDLTTRLKWWLEEQEDWLYKLGERVLDRMW